jgi:hypothetical protein
VQKLVRQPSRFVSLTRSHGPRQVPESDDELGDSAEEMKRSKMNWNSNSSLARHKLKMPADSAPWSPDHQLTGIMRGSKPRHVDVVDCAFWAYLLAHPNRADRSSSPTWFCDPSQGVERTPWSGSLGCINQDSIPYCFQLDRILTPEDCHVCSVGRLGHSLNTAPKFDPARSFTQSVCSTVRNTAFLCNSQAPQPPPLTTQRPIRLTRPFDHQYTRSSAPTRG